MTDPNDDYTLVEEVSARLRVGPRRSMGSRATSANSPASQEEIQHAESQLGFPIPPLLRRIFAEVADGGFGPAYGIFPIRPGYSEAGQDETLVAVYEKLALDPKWPALLLPICDWGCANWSCLDCRTDDGAIVTLAEEQGFFDTRHRLRSWLRAWLGGADLWNEMFEPGPTKIGINPFTKQPLEIKGRGTPRGPAWP